MAVGAFFKAYMGAPRKWLSNIKILTTLFSQTLIR